VFWTIINQDNHFAAIPDLVFLTKAHSLPLYPCEFGCNVAVLRGPMFY